MDERRSGQLPGPVRVSLMGGFEVRWDGEPIAIPGSARRLLAFLALHDRPVERLFVAGSLWTESSEGRSGASLRSALWRLQRPGLDFVRVEGNLLQLSPDVGVDSRELSRRAALLLDRPDACEAPSDLSPVGMLDDLLPDWYDDWVVVERERLRQLRLHALEALTDRLVGIGRMADAVQAGLAAVRGEPLRESSHRALMRAHLADGNQVEALRQYRAYRDLLWRELGVEPSPRMQVLLDAMRVTSG